MVNAQGFLNLLYGTQKQTTHCVPVHGTSEQRKAHFAAPRAVKTRPFRPEPEAPLAPFTLNQHLKTSFAAAVRTLVASPSAAIQTKNGIQRRRAFRQPAAANLVEPKAVLDYAKRSLTLARTEPLTGSTSRQTPAMKIYAAWPTPRNRTPRSPTHDT